MQPFNSILRGPQHRLSTHGRLAFYIAAPIVCNSLPDPGRNSNVTEAVFSRLLTPILFARYYSMVSSMLRD